MRLESRTFNDILTEQLSNRKEEERHKNSNLYFSIEAKKQLAAGIAILAKAVGCTLGAKGRLVMYDDNYQTKVTKDGVTVAESIVLDNPVGERAARFIKQAARHTANSAGDGTTTTVILTDYLVNSILPFVNEQTNIYALTDAIKQASKIIEEEIKTDSRPINIDYIYKIAYTSSNNNHEIAEAIKNIYEQLSDLNVEVVLHPSSDKEDKIELQNGYSITYPTNNHLGTTENLYGILLDYKVHALGVNLGQTIHNYCQENKTPFLIICKEYTPELIEDCKATSKRYGYPVYVIKTDLYGIESRNQLEDLALALGTEVQDYALDRPFQENDSLSPVFELERLISSPEETYLILPDVSELISSLEELKTKHKDPVMQENIDKRIHKLQSMTCNYFVGGQTQTEMFERKDRIEDALLAVKAAVKHGVVPGGGIQYIKSSKKLIKQEFSSEEEEVGYRALYNALSHPLKILVKNAGLQSKFREIYEVINENNGEKLYNFKTSEYEDVTDTNIFDSSKTSIDALNNSVSVAIQILLTETVIL